MNKTSLIKERLTAGETAVSIAKDPNFGRGFVYNVLILWRKEKIKENQILFKFGKKKLWSDHPADLVKQMAALAGADKLKVFMKSLSDIYSGEDFKIISHKGYAVFIACLLKHGILRVVSSEKHNCKASPLEILSNFGMGTKAIVQAGLSEEVNSLKSAMLPF